MARQQQRQGYASRREVAEYLDLPLATLDAWAYRGRGPAFVKIGRHARYRWSDIDTWIGAQKRGGGDAA